ncbi:hypothetical protein EW146_g6396 [Bondarzewia mesenterica]|uniref:Uncharacterized protein n=1 Tax=Bondarzewia mesenterica TaxID=1095465 RepID=A0A4S4LNS7_9AGAM|nr:hypothetical protein EW146_g6396 [Bondarzewia mesenterica]
MQSLTSTLSIQPVQPDQEASQQQAQAGTDVSANDVQEPVTDAAIAAPSESTPTKRGPGRPKGSGVKTKYIDPNAPPPLKRPVGRPRKDGLPAGSVPRPNAISTRKRRVAAPGEFAVAAGDVHSNQATPQASASAPPYPGPQLNYAQYVYPTTNAATPQPTWQTGYSTLSAALQVDLPAPRRETASVPVGRIARESHSIDPNLAEDDWAVLMRTDRTALLHNLVTALYAPNPLSATGQPIEMAFRFHIDRLAPLPDAPPNLTAYSTLRTYWLPSSPAYFSLFASSSKTPTPPEYRFFYWDPHHLALMGIACPHCSAP